MQESIFNLLKEWVHDLEETNVLYGAHTMNHDYIENQIVISFLKTKIRAIKKNI